MNRRVRTTASAGSIRIIKRWLLPAVDSSAAAALSAALGVARPIAEILCARGYSDPSGAQAFLNPQIAQMHDPHLLRDLTPALDRIRRAIQNSEKILICGDYDVDGTTSTVILKTAIQMAGGTADFHIPHRLKEGYGLHESVIEQAAADGVTLVISVDTGIRAGEVVARASQLGVDVIVTDHHLPEEALPPAFAVINPNRLDCAYPDKGLCGVGVAFKLVQALLAVQGWPEEKLQRVLESFLKLVAIGTVADVVPLTGENRIIVKHGLAGLRNVRSPGLKALLAVAGFDATRIPSAGEIAFRIAPRINAAGRMDSAAEVVELFTTTDAPRARELAEKLHGFNADRQSEESQIVDECAAIAVDPAHFALVYSSADWHRGVLGIVASRMVERHHRPVIVLSEENGVARGSGRSIPQFHLLDALESMADLFDRFGGHRHAAGLTLATAKIPLFRERLNAYAAARLTAEDFRPALRVDACVDLRELNGDVFDQLQQLAPFGAGNPNPVFVARGLEVAHPVTYMKEKHIKVTLRQGDRTQIFKGFHFADRVPELPMCARIDAAFQLEPDSYNGGFSAILKDIQA